MYDRTQEKYFMDSKKVKQQMFITNFTFISSTNKHLIQESRENFKTIRWIFTTQNRNGNVLKAEQD